MLFLEINGVGYKTLDYTLKLLNFDTIPVDRHIIAFIKEAGITHSSYFSTKKTVEYAADLLEISRSSFDATIWNYMSNRKKEKKSIQLELNL